MPTSSQVVANAFLDIARNQGKRLTNMQLQKLVFLANGYTLALLNRPLHSHDTHAWQWGPVIPRLYRSLQIYGSDFVTKHVRIPPDGAQPVEPEEQEIIQAVWDAYGDHTGVELSAITHKPGTPWSETWKRKEFSIIPPEFIAAYYKKLIEVP